MPRVRATSLLLGLALVAPPAALAQDDALTDAPVVVRSGDAALRAADRAPARGGGICVGLTVEGGQASACGNPLQRDDDAVVLATSSQVFAGVVPAAAEAVQVVLPDGRRLRTAVQRSDAYRGKLAGRVAFFAVRRPAAAGDDDVSLPGDPFGEVRVLGAGDALVGVQPGSGVALGPVRQVGAQRVAGGAEVRLRVRRESVLRPVATDLDRHVERACLLVDVRAGAGTSSGSTCVSSDGREASDTTSLACTARASVQVLVGALDPGVSAASALLADGRRRAARTVALAAGRRAYAYVAPATVGVRRIEAGGTTVALGAAPARSECAASDGEGSQVFSILELADLPPAAPTGPPADLVAPPATVLAAEGHRLVAGDHRDGRLCLAVDRDDLRDADCTPLGRSPGAILGRALPLPGGGRVLAGVAREGATSLRLGSPVSARALATSTPDPAYTGAAVRAIRPFLTVEPPGPTATAAAIALAPDGRRLDPEGGFVFSVPDPLRAVRRVASLPGGLVAWVVDVRGVASTRTVRCGAVTRGARPQLVDVLCDDDEARTADVRVVSRCAPRATVAMSVLRGRSWRLTAGGRRARRIALGDGEALHVAVLGARRALGSVRVSRGGLRPERQALRLPAARAQCGFGLEADLLLRPR
ncbi:hypothetical protein [Conexibacter sp. SYSU D00693]|uniref:hypothetical protein n=1 Tax=Conexibacter sp. SYSU D00693 TaxID=2812560 RepID=UPI00196B1043|nr:hypothetical protein [Conexibacter sp. SYSU D00693]